MTATSAPVQHEKDALLEDGVGFNEGVRRNRWLIGVLCVVIVAIIWTFASVLVQYVFHDLGFSKPFFLTYVANSLFAVNLPLYYIGKKLGYVKTEAQASVRDTLWVSAVVAPLWFIANCAYNFSLNMTSTIISSTSSMFTFALSVFFLGERFAWFKIAGVVFCMAGNIVTVLQDGSSGTSDSFTGDSIALVSAFMYAVYTSTMRKYIPDDSSMSLSLFFGLLGLLNFVCLLPVVLFLHFTNVESLQSLTVEILGLLTVKGLFDNVLSDYLWALAMLYTTPTVATIGLSLTVRFFLQYDIAHPQVQGYEALPSPPADHDLTSAVVRFVGRDVLARWTHLPSRVCQEGGGEQRVNPYVHPQRITHWCHLFRTAIGINCKDGVVMGVEKVLLSKLLVPGTHRRIHAIDRHIGLVRPLELKNYGSPIPPQVLADRMSQYVHYFTLYGSVRPFGTSIMLAGRDVDTGKTFLNVIEPSGVSYRYRGAAMGKGEQAAKTEIEKYKIFDLTCREAIKYIAKILNVLHDEVKHPFELELSWLCEESNWQHQLVPGNIRDEATAWAVRSIQDDDIADDADDA
ncbi:hypothetical protein DYB36_008544 [Aphanomyces astaci]|uniref:EamA domain-containing protein n=1 Tax=Aphanomyces astaci TaxID=112090 RepID=A0A397AUC5_APHAT|nr:hypothetical protein DYB36_008544 [Aphanomyces astaci]